MLESGHPGACHYPIGMLMDEASIVEERLQSRTAANAVMFQMAISTRPVELTKPAISAANKVLKQFRETVNAMLGKNDGR